MHLRKLGMAEMDRRELIMGATLLGGGLAGFAVKPSKPKEASASIEGILPAYLGDWTRIERSFDSVPQPSAYTQSIYEQVVAGHYVSPNSRVVTLLLAYNQAQNYASQLHRPDVCYPASGFQILHHEDVDMDISARSIPVRIFDTRRAARLETVLFWTRIGSTYPRSLTQQRLEILRAALSLKKQDGIVVRASMATSMTGDSGDVLIRFAQELAESLSNAQAELLIGPMS